MEDKPWIDRIQTFLNGIHPGHIALGTSLPFCYRAYRDYSQHATRLEESIAQPIVRNFTDGYLDESARRAVGVAVASRALRIATAASVGVFGVCFATLLYATKCNTMEAAIRQTTDWAHVVRSKLDDTFHIQRIDRNHPEYKEALALTEDEELQKYFPAEDFEDEVQQEE